jgi:hypothetical protein
MEKDIDTPSQNARFGYGRNALDRSIHQLPMVFACNAPLPLELKMAMIAKPVYSSALGSVSRY